MGKNTLDFPRNVHYFVQSERKKGGRNYESIQSQKRGDIRVKNMKWAATITDRKNGWVGIRMWPARPHSSSPSLQGPASSPQQLPALS